MTSPPPDDLSPAAPRTLTLAEVEAGTVRAAARVAQWPEWKREIGDAPRRDTHPTGQPPSGPAYPRDRPVGQDLRQAGMTCTVAPLTGPERVDGRESDEPAGPLEYCEACGWQDVGEHGAGGTGMGEHLPEVRPTPAAPGMTDLLGRLEDVAVGLPAQAARVVRDAAHALTRSAEDRASIVAFLTAEAVRFDAEAKEASRDQGGALERLRAQASLLRTLAAQIARGDDRLGGGQ